MLHLLRRKTHSAHGEGGPLIAAALANDLGLLFSTLANPLGRPPAHEWGQAAATPAVATGARWARPGRLAGGLIAGLATVVLTAAGFAAVTNTDLADRMFSNFGSTAGQPGVYPIGVSQTIDGVTVTVDHAVFDGQPVEEITGPDGHRVTYVPAMVQFTVSGLPDVARYSMRDSLASDGRQLRRAGGVGLRGHSDVLQRELPSGTEQFLFAYDTSGLPLESGSLPLHLEITVTPRGGQGYEGGESSSPGLVVTPVSGPNGTPIRFVFDFEVPTR